MAAMTRAELLDVVYRFYPRAIYVGGLGYEDTVERQRQRDAVRRAVDEAETWKAMRRRLEARYEMLMEQSWHLLYGEYLPAYEANLCIPGRRLGFCVSVLGPYYGIRRTDAPGEEAAARDLAREIEATYPGYQPIPPELGNEIVPDVALDTENFGSATIYQCLLSDAWGVLSGPWPKEPSPTPVPEAAPVRPSPGQKILRRGDEDREPGEEAEERKP